MVDNAQLADGQDLLGQEPPAQNLLGQEQLEQEVERPLYITTASTHIVEDDTKYNWMGDSPIICICLTDLQLDDELLLQILAQPLDIQAKLHKYHYLEATLTEQEVTTYNQQANRSLKQAYLQLLLEAVEEGTRHMYLYQPVPRTLGDKIAAM